MTNYQQQAARAKLVQQRLMAYLVELEERYPFAKGVYLRHDRLHPTEKTALDRDIEQVVYILEEKRCGYLKASFPLPEKAVANILSHFPDAESILKQGNPP